MDWWPDGEERASFVGLPFRRRAALSNQFALCLAAGKLSGRLEGAVSVVRARPAIELRSLPRGHKGRESRARMDTSRERERESERVSFAGIIVCRK
jgi:hypothetical protein